MITVLDSEDVNRYGNINLTTLKKAELSFATSGAVTDAIIPTETPFKLVAVPAPNVTIDTDKREIFSSLGFFTATPSEAIAIAEGSFGGVIPSPSVTVDTSKRMIFDQITFMTPVALNTITITESPFASTTPSNGVLGFCTDYVRTNLWDNVKEKTIVGELTFTSAPYSDVKAVVENALASVSVSLASQNAKCFLLINSALLNFYTAPYADKISVTESGLSGSIPLATVNKPRFFDGLLNFYALPLSSVKGLLTITDVPGALEKPLGELMNRRLVPLSGTIISDREFDLIVLDPTGSFVLHKGTWDKGAFSATVETEDDKVIVLAVSKDDTKKSYIYKNINIEGVQL